MAPNLKVVPKSRYGLASDRPGGYVDPQWSGKISFDPQPFMTNAERAVARLPSNPTKQQVRQTLFTYDGRPRYTGVCA